MNIGACLANIDGHISASVLKELKGIAQIDGPLRMAHFLSQCDHESAGFTKTVENLNYSAERLLVVFPKYFKGKYDEEYEGQNIGKHDAKNYERRPKSIANLVYANRMGNGGVESNDGYNYRGRGYLQLTGRNNYSDFSQYIGDDCLLNPWLVEEKYPLQSAAWYFTVNNLWTICDTGISDNTVKILTKKINGGYNGLKDRIKLFNKYYSHIKGL
jgi:putative chitinase